MNSRIRCCVAGEGLAEGLEEEVVGGISPQYVTSMRMVFRLSVATLSSNNCMPSSA